MKWYAIFLTGIFSIFFLIIFFFIKAPQAASSDHFDKAFSAQLEASDIPKTLQTPENLAAGKLLFITSCEHCHGGHGQGTPKGPDLSDSVWIHGKGSYADIVSVIQDGVEQSTMIAWSNRFRKSDIELIAAYVRALQKGAQ